MIARWEDVRITLDSIRHYRHQVEHGRTPTARTQAAMILKDEVRNLKALVDELTGRVS